MAHHHHKPSTALALSNNTFTAVAGTNYYIDPTIGGASDSNNGTSTATPWLTLAHLNQAFTSGSTIFIRAGTSYTSTGQTATFAGVGTAAAPVTVTRFGLGANPVIQTTSTAAYTPCAFVVSNAAFAIVDSLEVTLPGISTTTSPFNLDINTSHDVTIRLCEISQGGGAIRSYTGCYNVKIHANYIHDLGEISNSGSSSTSVGGEGITIWNNPSGGIEVAYNYFLNCRCPSTAFGYDGGIVEFWEAVNGVTIHDNFCNNSEGFCEGGSDHNTDVCQNVQIYNNVIVNSDLSWMHNNTGTSFGMTFNNFTISYNTLYQNRQMGVNVNLTTYDAPWFDSDLGIGSTFVFGNNLIYCPTSNQFYSGTPTHTNNFYQVGTTPTGTGETAGTIAFVNPAGNNYHATGSAASYGAYANGGLASAAWPNPNYVVPNGITVGAITGNVGTLSLSGTYASLFQIVGGNLVTKGPVTQGTYPVTIVDSAGPTLPVTLTGATASLSSVSLSANSFVGGVASGTVVGAITVVISSGSFTGSLSLSGTNAASFQIVGTNLETNGVVTAGSYNINIVATQAGATGSPLTVPFTITGSAPVLSSIALSNASFTGGSASGTVVGTITVNMLSGSIFTGSLSLTGTNASSFQISGTNLETNGVVATGSYSINIVATQSGATGSPLTQAETITGTTAGLTAPSQASAAGFNTLVFSTDFTVTTDVATTSGQTTGAKWYWASGCTPSFTINTGAGSGVTAGATGILTENGWTGQSFGPNFSTVPPNATNSVTTGVWNHGYFECRMQFGATVAGSGAPGGIHEPSFWLKDARNLTSAGSGSYHFAETDIMEYYPNGTSGSTAKYISTCHNWFDNASSYSDQFNTNTTNFDSSHQPGDGAWHIYGMLWTGNGTTGQVSFYFDNILCTHQSGVQFYALNINGSPTAALTAMENANMFLNISSAGSGWPVNFDYIRVWQSP